MSEKSYQSETTGAAAGMIYALAAAPGVQPNESGVVFAAHSAGLLRSADGGQTWSDALEPLNLAGEVPVTSLALSPIFTKEQRVIAGAPGGVFLSTDGGESWKAIILASPPPTVSALAASPDFETDETIFAGTMEDGVFVSRNGGENWVAWNFGLLDLNVMCLAVSPRFAEDETVLAGTETGIFRSTNGGRAWREVDLPFGFDPVLSLAFMDGKILAGTENEGLWQSPDGETWERVAPETIADPVNGIIAAESALLVVAGSTVWQSLDGGASWQQRALEAPEEEGEELSTLAAPLGIHGPVLAGLTGGQIFWTQLK